MKPLDLSTPCWVWPGAIGEDGYPVSKRAYRRIAWSYHEEVDDGTREVDHMCQKKSCVNPLHLDIVSHTENMKRVPTWHKTHCRKGHVFTPENTYSGWGNKRKCRACNAAIQRARYARRGGERHENSGD